jgi:protein MpaA
MWKKICFGLFFGVLLQVAWNRVERIPPAKSEQGSPINLDQIESKQVNAAQSKISSWCEEVNRSILALKWKVDPCKEIQWQVGGTSVRGRPLVFAEFGDLKADNTTLIFSTVHGDEVTPLYLGLQLAHWLKERQGQLIKTRVVIAPLVNPDSFFSHPRTRMNARGVDVNRNFATRDWPQLALAVWKKKYRSDPRRFPGDQPRSEPETQFQEELIRRTRPQKILSIHSPLNFLDYDGPSSLSLSKFPNEYTQVCDRLKKRLKAVSTGYFPGSLGNYAGRELGIPTLTLELPSADPTKADQYWKQFSQGIRTMIQFTVPNYASSQLDVGSGG